MPSSFSLTDEGDLYLLAVLAERMLAGDIVLYPLTSIFNGNADTFTFSDLAAHTHSGFVADGLPGLILGPASLLGSEGKLYGYLQWSNWRATNATGSAQGVHGYAVVDTEREKVLFCSTFAVAGAIANGSYKDFSLVIALDNGPGTLP